MMEQLQVPVLSSQTHGEWKEPPMFTDSETGDNGTPVPEDGKEPNDTPMPQDAGIALAE